MITSPASHQMTSKLVDEEDRSGGRRTSGKPFLLPIVRIGGGAGREGPDQVGPGRASTSAGSAHRCGGSAAAADPGCDRDAARAAGGGVARDRPARVRAINPLAVARYRERHSVAGRKSDHAAAVLLANILRTDKHLHRPIPDDSDEVGALAGAGRAHHAVGKDLRHASLTWENYGL